MSLRSKRGHVTFMLRKASVVTCEVDEEYIGNYYLRGYCDTRHYLYMKLPVQVLMEPALWQQLEASARKMGRSRQDLARDAIYTINAAVAAGRAPGLKICPTRYTGPGADGLPAGRVQAYEKTPSGDGKVMIMDELTWLPRAVYENGVAVSVDGVDKRVDRE